MIAGRAPRCTPAISRRLASTRGGATPTAGAVLANAPDGAHDRALATRKGDRGAPIGMRRALLRR
jgi:hypothetical protein